MDRNGVDRYSLKSTMKQGQPSWAAELVAKQRAAHQLLDPPPLVLVDPLAPRILSREIQIDPSRESERLKYIHTQDMRAFVVARSRYTEDLLAQAVAAGVGQYVILGAGLDTFAYRNPFAALRVFEVDHPSTQAWKRECLAAAAIPIPPDVVFAPVDFAVQSLEEGLAAVGFQLDQPAFFSWLGVTYYLPLDSFRNTLGFLGARPPTSGLVVDYFRPRGELAAPDRQILDATASLAAALGEPFLLFFSLEQMKAELSRAGFTDMKILTGPDIQSRYYAQRTDGLALRGAMAQIAGAWIRDG